MDLSSLNDNQYKAVQTTEGPLLVLAGAGSGKTRVLTYRIAHLIKNCGVAPWEILAITFTNKAAEEMRQRLETLIGPVARRMWVSTFHSMCVRILRNDAHRLGFSDNFSICDADDSKKLIKECMNDLEINPARIPVNSVLNFISKAKNELKIPSTYAIDKNASTNDSLMLKIYEAYQEKLHAQQSMDFDDLLLYTYLLFKQFPEVLSAYRERFVYILVDEYQDTNHAQYVLVKMLGSAYQNVMVVGDDDQSIYSWRGADIRNILEFERDYPQANVVKLEENYRSVGNILAAANAVIKNNFNRKAKTLFTSAESGEKIHVYVASDERDEGRWIAGETEKRHTAGLAYNDFAVFYRTNAQSRILEDMMIRAGIPYRIVGGTKFFERAEIKDIMAYLSLAVNPYDDMSAHRVINTPRRGIGDSSVKEIDALCAKERIPFIQACHIILESHDSARFKPKTALERFVSLMDEVSQMSGSLRTIVEFVLEQSGMLDAYEREGTEDAKSRIENLNEFLGVVDEYVLSHTDEEIFAAPEAEFEGDTRFEDLMANEALNPGFEEKADAEILFRPIQTPEPAQT
ncbi:MAG: UvrD-helicase domain-containing protein, partial [Eggerthellaceae bacterium]|nr:UvrD-helicase domain-containing protein [Eggerthellaceae bacterium]